MPLSSPIRQVLGTSDWDSLVATVTDLRTYENLGVHLLKVMFIILMAWLAAQLGRRIVMRAMSSLVEGDEHRHIPPNAARYRTLVAVMGSLVRYTVYLVAFLTVMATWNPHTISLLGTALGTAGILGVVVGFGAQKLVRDIFAGIFILAEDQYSVGDTVTISAVTGVVEDLGIRITRIRDESGRLHLMPNGDITQVTNHSRGGLEVAVEIGVALEQDLGQFRKIIEQAGVKVMAIESSPMVSPAELQGITALDGTKLTLRIAGTAATGQQRAAEMALRGAIRDEMLAAGVKPV